MGSAVSANKAQRFDAVQALRFLCFMVVFGVHSGMFFGAGTGIILEVFIILSGFMLMYSYRDKELKANPVANFRFAFRKISKIYPLHALTTTAQWGIYLWFYAGVFSTVPFAVVAQQVGGFYPKYLLHMTLLHAWVPDENLNFMFNGPSWYLSVTVFTYFMFPWIFKLIQSIKDKRGLVGLGVGVLIFMYALGFVANTYGDKEMGTWIMAHSPITKLGDFIIGCIVGRMFADWKNCSEDKPYSKVKWTFIELIAVACVVALQFIIVIPAKVGIYDNYSFVGTVVFNLLAVFLVMIFILNRGFVTKILANKVFIYLGDISAYTYLTHYIFTIFWSDYVMVHQITNEGWIKWCAIAAEFVLTIATGALCHYIAKTCALRKKQKMQAKA